ncbi:MAG: hypothetical protein ABEJ76_07485 [Halanaeroarchaeum sp.]
MITDETLRDVIGGGLAGLVVYVIGLAATRGQITPGLLFGNLGLLLLAGVLVGGGGVFARLLRAWLTARGGS